MSESSIQSVDNALKKYFEEVNLEEYKCPFCEAKSSTKSAHIKLAPEIIILQLKCFTYSYIRGGEKIEKRIEFPEKVSLKEFMGANENTEYELISIIVHNGSQLLSGHYYSLAKYESEYIKLNDRKVSKIDKENFFMEMPYLLFYVRKSKVTETKIRNLTIRANTLKTTIEDLTKALFQRGINIDPITWTNEGFIVKDSQIPVGSTPEYLAGHYSIENLTSLLPVMALAPREHDKILDLCSGSGEKATHIAALMKNTGVLFANDADQDKGKVILQNLHRLGITNTIVCCLDGCEFSKSMVGFDRVLCHAPSSGSDEVLKDTSVKASKDKNELLVCVKIQQQLLMSAIDCTNANSKNGGYIVYSTCSILPEENESVVNYVLQKGRVQLVSTGLDFGKEGLNSYKDNPLHPALKLTRRYIPHLDNIGSLFIAKFKKIENVMESAYNSEASDGAPSKQTISGVSSSADKTSFDPAVVSKIKKEKAEASKAATKPAALVAIGPAVATPPTPVASDGNENRDLLFSCASCQYQSLDEQDFMKHTRTDHRSDLFMWCKQCDKCFSNDGVLVSHIKKKSCMREERIYRCGVKECTFETTSGQTFVHHLRHCHKGSPFIFCIHCQKIFTLPHCLILHMQDDCPYKDQNHRNQEAVPSSSRAPTTTPAVTASKPETTTCISAIASGTSSILPSTPIVTVASRDCGTSELKSPNDLGEMRSVAPLDASPICFLDAPKNLKRSKEDSSDDLPNKKVRFSSLIFVCSHCGATYFSKDQVVAHSKKEHTHVQQQFSTISVKEDGEKRFYKCEFCQFTSEQDFLDMHLKTKHTSRVTCDHCSKRFEFASKLKEHHDAVHKGMPVKYTQETLPFIKKKPEDISDFTHNGSQSKVMMSKETDDIYVWTDGVSEKPCKLLLSTFSKIYNISPRVFVKDLYKNIKHN